jgi:hypothetical protein
MGEKTKVTGVEGQGKGGRIRSEDTNVYMQFSIFSSYHV